MDPVAETRERPELVSDFHLALNCPGGGGKTKNNFPTNQHPQKQTTMVLYLGFCLSPLFFFPPAKAEVPLTGFEPQPLGFSLWTGESQNYYIFLR